MIETKKIFGTPEAWENRELGADEQFAVPAPESVSVELDAQIEADNPRNGRSNPTKTR